MTKEEILAFLEANLKDGGNRVGIKMTTDGDPGPSIGLFCDIVYNYPSDLERLYGGYDECLECEGNGVIYDEDGEEQDCYECEGSGEIENNDVEDASEVVVVYDISKEEVLRMIDTMLYIPS
jgi:hypothetical protein